MTIENKHDPRNYTKAHEIKRDPQITPSDAITLIRGQVSDSQGAPG